MKKNNKGFSLVELIVVIAIMAILAAVAVVSYSIYIERARDAADQEYLDNIVYFSELFAIEHQIPLEWVEIAPEVDGPEDIKLICKNPDGSYYEYTEEDKKEVFEAVGAGKTEGGLNNGKYVPGQGGQNGQNPPPSVGGDPTCNHDDYKKADEQAATCTQAGWIAYECNSCSEKWTDIIPAEHAFEKVQNTKYEVCKKCGYIRGGVVVPID